MRLIGAIVAGKEYTGILRLQRLDEIDLIIETTSGSTPFRNVSPDKVSSIIDGDNAASEELIRIFNAILSGGIGT